MFRTISMCLHAACEGFDVITCKPNGHTCTHLLLVFSFCCFSTHCGDYKLTHTGIRMHAHTCNARTNSPHILFVWTHSLPYVAHSCSSSKKSILVGHNIIQFERVSFAAITLHYFFVLIMQTSMYTTSTLQTSRITQLYYTCRVSCFMVIKGNILVLYVLWWWKEFFCVIVMEFFGYSDEMEFLERERERITEISPFFYGDEMEDFCFMIDDEMEDAMHALWQGARSETVIKRKSDQKKKKEGMIKKRFTVL